MPVSTRSDYPTPSQAAHNALNSREDFSLWAEAVRQQMLHALQKRQKA
ncbi:hypothetical protein GFS31_10520 [Leptolyngbya sp. BL0902]|nr:hypothetical protein [Leptolyngbya sp. BL0902]QQE64372.1 hypothetical protein GFS31_10520 [Leptolyngbya sp. BL0902]